MIIKTTRRVIMGNWMLREKLYDHDYYETQVYNIGKMVSIVVTGYGLRYTGLNRDINRDEISPLIDEYLINPYDMDTVLNLVQFLNSVCKHT